MVANLGDINLFDKIISIIFVFPYSCLQAKNYYFKENLRQSLPLITAK